LSVRSGSDESWLRTSGLFGLWTKGDLLLLPN
jgi:hypothetical protein